MTSDETRSLDGAPKHERPEEKPDPPKRPTVTIRIDRKEYTISPIPDRDGKITLTGAEIRQLPDPHIGPDRDLFEIVPGGSDRKIENDEEVLIRNGMRFFSAPAQINPGCRADVTTHESVLKGPR